MGSRWCAARLLPFAVSACAPIDVDVPAHVVTVKTNCLGEPATLTFSVPDWDVDVPTCLLDPMCERGSSALGAVPQLEGPPGMELSVWGHDERGLDGYTAKRPLGTVDGRATFRWCDADLDQLGRAVLCVDRDSHGDAIDTFSEPCEATFTQRPTDSGG